jgi:hypothetical protein
MTIIKRPPISKHELIADALYFFLSAFLSFLAVFVFDIHHSFYPGNHLYPPTFIFTSVNPYIFGILFGGFIGFFLLKIMFWAFIEEEAALETRVPQQKNAMKK